MPLDALACVFAKLGAVELLMGAGLVCCSWLHASKSPELWRAVVMSHPPDTPEGTEAFLRAIAKVSSELWPAVPITSMNDPSRAMAKVDDVRVIFMLAFGLLHSGLWPPLYMYI
ncbi:uncharacterized protein [Triticum aestivum]|uniref:uncharacterized protein n=1 Tax=Triticum aestivum TaxID=4565 RepID=UPI001D0314C6|nr:uncharacterized protein LOC123156042 [Triticum aestivum]